MRNETPIVILQHPRERFHPFGTALLAAHALERAELEVCWDVAKVHCSPGDWVLYPDPKAPCLSDLPARPGRLIVVDGTWYQAHRLLRDSPALAALPRARLAPVAPSRYRVRREPRAECLSTLESVVAALRELEPETAGLAELLAAFDAMNEDQVALTRARRHEAGAGRRRERVRARRALPRILCEAPERCVVVYGESAEPVAHPGTGGRGPRRPVQLAAVRLVSGECFERVIRVVPAPSDWHLGHMGLAPETVAGGQPLDAVSEAWRTFVGPAGVVLAWNQSTLDVVRQVDARDGIALKGVYANVTRDGVGTLEAVVERLGLVAEGLPFRGRARERVGNCLAVARWLLASAQGGG